MSENGNKNFKMQFVDKLIVSLIGIASLFAVILTFITVNYKYKKMYEQQMAALTDIPYNETYKYMFENNSIKFYQNAKEVGAYKCTTDCQITKFLSNQFIIDNDDLVPIIDNGKVIIFSIKNMENSLILDEEPQTSINNKYGIVIINNKYGVINKKGKIILDSIYDDIDINISHIVTLLNGTIYVFDNNAQELISRDVQLDGDISISEKNDNIYINIVGDTTVTFIFDTKTNNFIN